MLLLLVSMRIQAGRVNYEIESHDVLWFIILTIHHPLSQGLGIGFIGLGFIISFSATSGLYLTSGGWGGRDQGRWPGWVWPA